MATHSGYDVAGLTIGDAYTAVAVVWREPGSPVVAATADGNTLGNPVTATDAWIESRVTFLATATDQVVGLARTGTTTGMVHLGGTMLVHVASLDDPYVGPYFDGSTLASSVANHSWMDGTPYSGSTVAMLSPTPHLLTSAVTGTPSRPLVASLALRSPDGAHVTITIRSGPDGTELGSLQVFPTSDWKRYTVTSPYGRAAYLEISAIGTYEADQVLLEAGNLLLPYFDGDSDASVMSGYLTGQTAVEYDALWSGKPSESNSEMLWLGSTTIERCEGDWRPFLAVDSGELPKVSILMDYTATVPASEQIEPYERHLADVSCVEGPNVIREYSTESGAMREVDFLLVAGSPFAYGSTRNITTAEAPDAATYPNLNLWEDPAPVVITSLQILDPDCATIPGAPRPPAVPNICIANPTSWYREYVSIPADQVSAWSQTVPTVTLVSGTEAVRQARVRFYPNPFGYPALDVDPLSWCSEFILSYLPANTELTVDGLVSRAYASVDGAAELPASHLLYGTDGVPMSWPEMSCGIPYVMTVDRPAVEAGRVSVGLALTRRE